MAAPVLYTLFCKMKTKIKAALTQVHQEERYTCFTVPPMDTAPDHTVRFQFSTPTSIVLFVLCSEHAGIASYFSSDEPFGKELAFVLQQSSLPFSRDCLLIQHSNCWQFQYKSKGVSRYMRGVKIDPIIAFWCSTRMLCCGIRIPIYVFDIGCPSQVPDTGIPISSIFHAMATNQRSRAEDCDPHNYPFRCKT